MRKNRFLTFCCILFWVSLLNLSSVVSAAEAGKCLLSTGPAPWLASYIKKLDTTLSSIKSEARKITCDSSSLGASSSKLGTEITKIYNRESSFKNFTSSTNFWIYATVKSSLPREFIRDYLLLQKQSEKIQKSMDTVAHGCSNPWAIRKLWDILSDHLKLMQYFQEVITGKSDISSPSFAFIVIPTTLPSDILDVYGNTAKISCVNNSPNTKMLGEFSAKVWDLSSAFKDSTKNWKQAFSLITGADKTAYEKVEKQLLKKELGRQGLSTQQSAAMLKKLDKSNKEQLGIGTFLKDIGDRIGTMASSLVSALDKVADDLYNAAKTPNVGTYMNRLREIDTARSIIAPSSPDSINIVADYNAMKAVLSDENVTLEQWISRARMMHETLNTTIADIKANVDTAQKVCESQAKNAGWTCKY